MAHNDIQHSDKWLTSIAVEGLHNRLSFNVSLQQGINIIYGKNGLGKTTLLHIVANLSEADFERFEHLSFRRIIIRNNKGGSVTLDKTDTVLSVFINDQRTSYVSAKAELSDLERESIRSIVGERATYLPAFRSVLERMREGTFSYEERNNPEFEILQRAESQAYRSARGQDRMPRRDGIFVDSNVHKTLRCRQWFGDFVPVIRYPSITDVVSGLSDEWAIAQVAIANIEQKQFEAAFVEIFSTISQGDEGQGQQDQTLLLEEIKGLVALDDNLVQGPPKLSAYQQLVQIAEANSSNSKKYSNILTIYRNKLRDRKTEREATFSPISAFQDSINLFLNEKTLRVGSPNPVRVSRLRDQAVFIEPTMGAKYRVTALSSGERQIVTMLYSASRSPFKGGCCLIDEPELSLHVDWQRIVLKEIEKQYRGRQIIACTHSPEVGADHEESRVQFFSPQVLESIDDEIESEEPAGL